MIVLARAAITGRSDASGVRGAHQLVGQAEGILMERHRLTGEQAFAALVRSSQHRNVKLHEVAWGLVETGVLPAAG